jgi:hypothetical protein
MGPASPGSLSRLRSPYYGCWVCAWHSTSKIKTSESYFQLSGDKKFRHVRIGEGQSVRFRGGTSYRKCAPCFLQKTPLHQWFGCVFGLLKLLTYKSPFPDLLANEMVFSIEKVSRIALNASEPSDARFPSFCYFRRFPRPLALEPSAAKFWNVSSDLRRSPTRIRVPALCPARSGL